MTPRVLVLSAILCACASSVAPLEMCRSGMPKATKTCLVDGDTIWVNGVKYRLEGFDTPEPHTNLCGGRRERELATAASASLLDILNTYRWTLHPNGEVDRYQRGIATIRVNGMDVGDILVEEGLARHWPDGDEWWCE